MPGNIDAIDRCITKISSLGDKLEEVGDDLMHSSEVNDLASDINISQLNEGDRADGKSILPYYAPRTIQIKTAKGQETRFVNLRDEGDFQGGIRGRAYDKKFEMVGEDPKTSDLEERYGPILGIANKNLYKIRDFLKPQFIYFARKILHS